MSTHKLGDSEDLDLDMDIPDLDGDLGFSVDSGSRAPSTPTSNFTEGVKSYLTDSSNLERGLKSVLPEEYSSAWDAVDEGRMFADDLKEEVKKTLDPEIRRLKAVGRGFLPAVKSVLPKKISSRLEKMVESDEEGRFRVEQTKAQLDEQSIAGALGAIWEADQAKEKMQEEQKMEESVTRDIKEKITTEKTLSIDSDIRGLLDRLVTYQDTITSGYQKKSLEIKFRHYFAARDLLELAQGTLKDAVVSLRAIAHNTQLPDSQKELQSEMFRKMRKEALYGKVLSTIGGPLSGYFDRLKGNIMEGVRNTLGTVTQVTEGLSQIGEAYQQAPDLDSFGEDTAELSEEEMTARQREKITKGFGSGLTGMAANKLFDLIAPHVKKDERIANLATKLGYYQENAPALLERERKKESDFSTGNEMVDSFLNTVTDFFKKALPPMDEYSETIKTTLSEHGTRVSQFDEMTRRSIIEIIPGYLSRILQSVQQIASGGEEVERMVYDVGTEKFTEQSKVVERFKEKFIGEDRAKQIQGRFDQLFDYIDKDKKLTQDDKALLRKQMLADLKANKEFDPYKYTTKAGFKEPVSEFQMKRISTVFNKPFTRDESGKGAKIDETLRKASRLYTDAGKSVGTTQEMISAATDLGQREELAATGLFTDKGQLKTEALLKSLGRKLPGAKDIEPPRTYSDLYYGEETSYQQAPTDIVPGVMSAPGIVPFTTRDTVEDYERTSGERVLGNVNVDMPLSAAHPAPMQKLPMLVSEETEEPKEVKEEKPEPKLEAQPVAAKAALPTSVQKIPISPAAVQRTLQHLQSVQDMPVIKTPAGATTVGQVISDLTPEAVNAFIGKGEETAVSVKPTKPELKLVESTEVQSPAEVTTKESPAEIVNLQEYRKQLPASQVPLKQAPEEEPPKPISYVKQIAPSVGRVAQVGEIANEPLAPEEPAVPKKKVYEDKYGMVAGVPFKVSADLQQIPDEIATFVTDSVEKFTESIQGKYEDITDKVANSQLKTLIPGFKREDSSAEEEVPKPILTKLTEMVMGTIERIPYSEKRKSIIKNITNKLSTTMSTLKSIQDPGKRQQAIDKFLIELEDLRNKSDRMVDTVMESKLVGGVKTGYEDLNKKIRDRYGDEEGNLFIDKLSMDSLKEFKGKLTIEEAKKLKDTLTDKQTYTDLKERIVDSETYKGAKEKVIDSSLYKQLSKKLSDEEMGKLKDAIRGKLSKEGFNSLKDTIREKLTKEELDKLKGKITNKDTYKKLFGTVSEKLGKLSPAKFASSMLPEGLRGMPDYFAIGGAKQKDKLIEGFKEKTKDMDLKKYIPTIESVKSLAGGIKVPSLAGGLPSDKSIFDIPFEEEINNDLKTPKDVLASIESMMYQSMDNVPAVKGEEGTVERGRGGDDRKFKDKLLELITSINSTLITMAGNMEGNIFHDGSILNTLKTKTGKLFEKGAGLFTGSFSLSRDILGGLSTVFRDVKEGALKDPVVDIYAYGPDEKDPRLTRRKLIQGKYLDVNSKKVVHRIKDITGSVVDLTEEPPSVVITDEEFKEGKIYAASTVGGGTRLWDKATGLGKAFLSQQLTISTALLKLPGYVMEKTSKFRKMLGTYTDLYLPGEDSPVIVAHVMRRGGYYSAKTGKPVFKISDIDGALLDVDGNHVLTLEQLQRGLYDSSGNKVDMRGMLEKAFDLTMGFARKQVMRTIKYTKKTYEFGKKMASKGVEKVKGALRKKLKLDEDTRSVGERLDDLSSQVMDVMPDLSGAMLNIVDKTVEMQNTMSGIIKESYERTSAALGDLNITGHKQTELLEGIYELLDERLELPEGIREGSWQNRLEARRKKLEEDKKEVADQTMHPGAMAANEPVQPKEEEGPRTVGQWITDKGGELIEDKLTSVGGKVTKKLGRGVMKRGKNLLKGGTKQGFAGTKKALTTGVKLLPAAGKTVGLTAGLASKAAAFGGGLASSVATGATALAGMVSAPVVIGAAAVGLAAYGGYKLYKGAQKKKIIDREITPLERYRLMQMGIDPKDGELVNAVRELEYYAINNSTTTGTGENINVSFSIKRDKDLASLLDSFGIDPDNRMDVATWYDWYQYRFTPILGIYLQEIHKHDIKSLGDYDLMELTGDDRVKIRKIISAVRIPKPILNSGYYPLTGDAFPVSSANIEKKKKALMSMLAGPISKPTTDDEDTTVEETVQKQKEKQEKPVQVSDVPEIMPETTVKELEQVPEIMPEKPVKETVEVALMPVTVPEAGIGGTKDSKVISPLERYRLMQMGIDPNDGAMVAAVRNLENYSLKNTSTNKSGRSIEVKISIKNEDAPSLIAFFGVDPDNKDDADKWYDWYSYRFVPILGKYIQELHKYNIENLKAYDETHLSGRDAIKIRRMIRTMRIPESVLASGRYPIAVDNLPISFINIENEKERLLTLLAESTAKSSKVTVQQQEGGEQETLGEKPDVPEVTPGATTKEVAVNPEIPEKEASHIPPVPAITSEVNIGTVLNPTSITPLKRYRLIQMGINPDDKEMVNAVSALESYAVENSSVAGSSRNIRVTIYMDSKNDLPSILESFGINPDDEAAVDNWYEWYNRRFVPVLVKYLQELRRNNIASLEAYDKTQLSGGAVHKIRRIIRTMRIPKSVLMGTHYPIVVDSPPISFTDIENEKARILALLEESASKKPTTNTDFDSWEMIPKQKSEQVDTPSDTTPETTVKELEQVPDTPEIKPETTVNELEQIPEAPEVVPETGVGEIAEIPSDDTKATSSAKEDTVIEGTYIPMNEGSEDVDSAVGKPKAPKQEQYEEVLAIPDIAGYMGKGGLERIIEMQEAQRRREHVEKVNLLKSVQSVLSDSRSIQADMSKTLMKMKGQMEALIGAVKENKFDVTSLPVQPPATPTAAPIQEPIQKTVPPVDIRRKEINNEV